MLVCFVDDFATNIDQFAPQKAVIDRLTVIVSVDHGDNGSGEADEILGATGFLKRLVLSNRAFNVTGLAIWPFSMSWPQAAKIRPCGIGEMIR